MDREATISRDERAVYRRLAEGEGGVLLHLDTAATSAVNETGALIWQLLEGAPTLSALVERVSGQVVEAPPTLAAEIATFVADLRDLGLVRVDEP